MSKSNLNLSRSEAVRLHREMWHWIAEQLEEMTKLSIKELEKHELYGLDLTDIKEKLCKRKGRKYTDINFYCFCCEYDSQRQDLINENNPMNNLSLHGCIFCLLKWGNESDVYEMYCLDEKQDDNNGLYNLCYDFIHESSKSEDYLRASQYAKQIAELPEKDVNAELATMIAEERGIIDYKVKGNRMIYYANWKEIQEHDVTYKVTIRLDTLKEERQKLNKYYQKGNLNRGL